MVDTPNKIILYGHPYCGMVPPVQKVLADAQAPYDYIDILQDREARTIVRTINYGNNSVPTLIFPDGTTLTEPSTQELQKKLAEQGYGVSLQDARKSFLKGALKNPLNYIWGGVFLYGVLKFLEIL